MKVLKTIQKLPVDIEEAWEFFSNPVNLKTITPPFMGFDITSGYDGKRMYQGMIVTYKVSPLFNIPTDWVTEITHVKEPHFFVDNQKSGPFKYWHHQHHFKEIQGGVEMCDIVNYAAPLGIVGRVVENVMVKQRVKEIFDFRFNKLIEIFGKYAGNEKR